VHGVEEVFPVNLDRDAAGISHHASVEGVANNLALTGDVYGDLQRLQLASGVCGGRPGRTVLQAGTTPHRWQLAGIWLKSLQRGGGGCRGVQGDQGGCLG
jgi:hypothetical protein